MEPTRAEIYYIEARRHLRLLTRRLVLSLSWLPVVSRHTAVQRMMREEAAYAETVRVLDLLEWRCSRSRSHFYIRYEEHCRFPVALSHVYRVYFHLDSVLTNSDCSALLDADTYQILILTSGHYFSYVTYHDDGAVSLTRGGF